MLDTVSYMEQLEPGNCLVPGWSLKRKSRPKITINWQKSRDIISSKITKDYHLGLKCVKQGELVTVIISWNIQLPILHWFYIWNWKADRLIGHFVQPAGCCVLLARYFFENCIKKMRSIRENCNLSKLHVKIARKGVKIRRSCLSKTLKWF